MAETKPAAEVAKPPASMAKVAKADGNPALRMMGLPRFRAKLPSRNWLIFLSITGSFTSALLYDRHRKKKAQQKWCKLVCHLAREPLPANQLPRKFTVFLSAPPGDGLRAAREYFTEYVKPVLVAAAIDWDVVEGRREGDVRAGLAERVRKIRQENGERPTLNPEEAEEEDMIKAIRQKAGIQPSEEISGDLVIGRHTWKEYIRGLQEGWLGPLDPPPDPLRIPYLGEAASLELSPNTASFDAEPVSDTERGNEDNSAITAISDPSTPPTETPRKPIIPTPPYITPKEYPNSAVATTIPKALTPAAALPFPHILGFLNTPIRTYRFLTQRYLTDDVGRAVADIILSKSTRPWEKDSASSTSFESMPDYADLAVKTSGTKWEQQGLYAEEEKEWHKSARAPNPADQEGKERVWQGEMILDARIGERMTTFVNSMVEEEQQQRIADEQDAEAITQAQRPGWVQSIKVWTGWSKDDQGMVKGWEHGLVGNESE